MGLTLSKRYRYKAAEASYREAIRLDPNYAPAYYGLGNILQKQGKHQVVDEAFKTAFRLNPESREKIRKILQDAYKRKP